MTNAEFNALQLGYLTGEDIAQYCSYQVLIKCYEVDNNRIQTGADNAYSEMIGYLYTKYDVQREFNTISGQRQQIVVKLTAILAVRDILGNMAGIGEVTKANFEWASDIILRTQQGLFNLPLYAASVAVNSGSTLVQSNFSFLG